MAEDDAALSGDGACAAFAWMGNLASGALTLVEATNAFSLAGFADVFAFDEVAGVLSFDDITGTDSGCGTGGFGI